MYLHHHHPFPSPAHADLSRYAKRSLRGLQTDSSSMTARQVAVEMRRRDDPNP